MHVAVAADFMAAILYSSYELRMFLCNPADDEKGCLDIKGIKYGEDIGGVLYYPGFMLVPIIRSHSFFKSRNLEVFFDINCKVIGDLLHSGSIQLPRYISIEEFIGQQQEAEANNKSKYAGKIMEETIGNVATIK